VGAVALQASDQGTQEYLVEAQLAGGGYLFQQCRADAKDRHVAAGANGCGSLGAAHEARLAEAVAVRQYSELFAVRLYICLSGNDNVEPVVHFAFADDILTAFVLMPVACAKHFPYLRMRELVKERQGAQEIEVFAVIQAVVLSAQVLMHPRQVGSHCRTACTTLSGILLHAHRDDVLQFLDRKSTR